MNTYQWYASRPAGVRQGQVRNTLAVQDVFCVVARLDVSLDCVWAGVRVATGALIGAVYGSEGQEEVNSGGDDAGCRGSYNAYFD